MRIIDVAQHVLGPYSPALQDYAEGLIIKRGFDLRLGVGVKEVGNYYVELSDGEKIPCGIVIWSTGVQPTKFINSLSNYP